MHYWKKTRPDMKMAADLKAMHQAKRIPREVTVFGDPDESGQREFLGTKIVYERASIPRRDLHRIAMGGPGRIALGGSR